MTALKPIHLRRDEFNRYIEENKVKLVVSEENKISAEEKQVIERCGVDYGLPIDQSLTTKIEEKEQKRYNIILRVKGNFTLPSQAHFRSENGAIIISPYVIHEAVSTIRSRILAKKLCEKNLVSSPVPMDEEYMYEALRETLFTREMEEIAKMGTGFQIMQVEFDENAHFKTLELDESITS